MSSQSTHTKPEKTMRILYAYTEFRNQKGQPSPCRGFEHFEINLGKRLFFHYEDGTLHVTHRDAILPEGFWGENIYNVTTLAGDNGSGKTTILNCVIGLMRQTWHGRGESFNRSILVLEDGERLAAVYAPGQEAGTDGLRIAGGGMETYILPVSRAVSLGWVSDAIRKTKLIYLTNTLNEEDYKRGLEGARETPQGGEGAYIHARDRFVYDCSTCGLMLSDYRNDVERTHLKGSEGENWLGIFFAYEQYKQVKYVFDKKQYAILRRLRKRGYRVPVPQKVTVTMESADARMAQSTEKGAAQLRIVLAKKAALFPGAVKRMKIWEEQIRDGAEIDEPSFFTDAVLYGLGCNCVLSFLRSCILNLEEAGKDDFVGYVSHLTQKSRDIEDVEAKLSEDEFLVFIYEIMDFYKILSQDRQNYMCRAGECYADFVRFLFEERGGLSGYFRMETTARDYVEGGMEKLRFAVSLDDAQWFSGFLQKYRYTCNPHYYLDFGWGLSSGENNLLRLFTSLYYIFERDYANEKNGHYQIYNYDKTHGRTACDTVILIMDEADLTYHPEWQRRFLSVITAFLQEIYPAQCCREMQILLSTHSPLLLGDMPRDNVVYLRADEKTGMTQADGSGRIETFGQNIHLILRDSFFLKKGTIGEFAAKKIQDVTDALEIIRIFLKGEGSGETIAAREEADGFVRRIEQELEPVIRLLADGIIKSKLSEMAQSYKRELKSLSGQTGSYEELTEEELRGQLARIRDELERRDEKKREKRNK